MDYIIKYIVRIMSWLFKIIDDTLRNLYEVKLKYPGTLLPITHLGEVEVYSEESVDRYGYVDYIGEGDPIRRSNIFNLRFSNSKVISLDSSSRSISYYGFKIYITGLAVYTPNGIFYEPSLDSSIGFISIKSNIDFLKEVESKGLNIRVKSIAGEYYDESYSDGDIADEARIEIENLGLTKYPSKFNNLGYIMIDGPVYPVPPILYSSESYEGRYIEAFKRLIIERVRILEDIDIPVIGIVKRCEQSRKLYRANIVRGLYKALYGSDPKDIDDLLLMEYITNRYRLSMNDFLILGPLRIRYSQSYMPAKIFWYISIKVGRGLKIYRVEVLEEHYNRYPNILDIVLNDMLSFDNISAVTGIPIQIELADRYSKRLTAALYKIFFERSQYILPVSYDEYMNYRKIIKELEV